MNTGLIQRLTSLLGRGRVGGPGPSPPRTLQLTGAKGTRITFMSDVPRQIQGNVTICLSIQHDRLASHPGQTINSVVTDCQNIGTPEQPQWECTGDISKASESFRYLLERMFHELPGQSNGQSVSAESAQMAQRRTPRVPCRFQVLSPDQRFKAMTLDLSRTGIRLQMDSALEPGTRLKLVLDLGISAIPLKDVEAEVIWCRQEANQRTHKVGLRFVDLPAAKSRAIAKYLELLQSGRI